MQYRRGRRGWSGYAFGGRGLEERIKCRSRWSLFGWLQAQCSLYVIPISYYIHIDAVDGESALDDGCGLYRLQIYQIIDDERVQSRVVLLSLFHFSREGRDTLFSRFGMHLGNFFQPG